MLACVKYIICLKGTLYTLWTMGYTCREYVQDFCAHYKTYSIMLLFSIIMKVYGKRYTLMISVIISIIHLM